jgi:hypothetical protein
MHKRVLKTVSKREREKRADMNNNVTNKQEITNIYNQISKLMGKKISALYQQNIYIINHGDTLKNAWKITARKLHKQTKP